MYERFLKFTLILCLLFSLACLSGEAVFINNPICTRVCEQTAPLYCRDVEVIQQGPMRYLCGCSCLNCETNRQEYWQMGRGLGEHSEEENESPE